MLLRTKAKALASKSVPEAPVAKPSMKRGAGLGSLAKLKRGVGEADAAALEAERRGRRGRALGGGTRRRGGR